jgi:hypothetical protein
LSGSHFVLLFVNNIISKYKLDKILERIETLAETATEKKAAFLQQEKAFYTALASKIEK